MVRRTLAAAAIAVMAGSAFGADYNYPSARTPGTLPIEDVKQYVSFIWDDNGYSGELGTSYEPIKAGTGSGDGGKLTYKEMGFVGGMIRDWSTDAWKMKKGTESQNPLNINEGDMGLSWARITLGGQEKPDPNAPQAWNDKATYPKGSTVVYNGNLWEATGYMAAGTQPGDASLPTWAQWADKGAVPSTGLTRTNPDGSPIHMTFNMISGLYVPAWGPGWQDRESHYGFYTDQVANPYVAEKSGHKRIAIAWGREGKYGTSDIPDRDGTDFMVQGVTKLIEAGHEIGNHTIDHIETNSPFPKDQWPNGGDGFDDGTSGTDAVGNPWSEVEEFGGHPDGFQQTAGWKYSAGRAIEQKTWEDIIGLGEVDGPLNGINEEMFGFRAPRLEVNSAMFFALKEKGYLYDCGLEEGYENFRDGTNFVWPYTTDNGNPNMFTQKMNGESIYIDSMPAGLWQYPVNTMIVPEEIRPAVFAQAQEIAAAEGLSHGELSEWAGNVTGFDFNMFILWGMTGEQVLKTLNHTLDLRMAGNKAPMQVGAHTDYFTPIYDNATLSNETNKDVFGLALKWNEWDDRKVAFEEFVDYGLSKGAYFKSGKQTIDYVKELLATENSNTNAVAVNPTEWTFLQDTDGSTGDATISSLDNAKITLATGTPWSGYMADLTSENFGGLSHVELEYNTDVPLMFTLLFEDNKRRDVLLNNLKTNVKSGKIPYGAFYDEQTGDHSTLDSKKIIGVAVFPKSNGYEQTEANFSVKNIKFHTAGETAIGDNINKTAKAGIAYQGINNGSLNLQVASAGMYSVDLYSLNGRLIKSIDRTALSVGSQNISIGNVPAGIYVLKVQSNTANLVTKAMIR